MNKEYASYDYQTTTMPFKTEYGTTIGTETKSSYKLCTKDCKYKNNWNELKKWLEEEKGQWGKDNSCWYESVLDKMQELQGDDKN